MYLESESNDLNTFLDNLKIINILNIIDQLMVYMYLHYNVSNINNG